MHHVNFYYNFVTIHLRENLNRRNSRILVKQLKNIFSDKQTCVNLRRYLLDYYSNKLKLYFETPIDSFNWYIQMINEEIYIIDKIEFFDEMIGIYKDQYNFDPYIFQYIFRKLGYEQSMEIISYCEAIEIYSGTHCSLL